MSNQPPNSQPPYPGQGPAQPYPSQPQQPQQPYPPQGPPPQQPYPSQPQQPQQPYPSQPQQPQQPYPQQGPPPSQEPAYAPLVPGGPPSQGYGPASQPAGPGPSHGPGGYAPGDTGTFGGLVGVDPTKERPVLSVRDLEVFYGAARALRGVSFDVYQGEIVSIIGSNGSGKSSTLRTISGVSDLLKSVRGKIWFKGKRIDQLPAHKIARLGIAHIPEGRRVFPQSSVEDNLILGAYRRSKRERRRIKAELDDIYDRFPVLAERRHRAAGLLSGGEQQMLAIGRGLMSHPEFLLLDEPSLGLAPILIRELFEIINDLAAEGTTILIVEQMAVQALEVADRAYVIETGAITIEGTGQELMEDPRVKEAYLGA